MEYCSLNTNKERREFWARLVSEKDQSEIERALSTLNPDSARVLEWHYIKGYPLPEIVSLLGKSISIVRNHHNRGIFMLQQYFIAAKKSGFNNARFPGNNRDYNQKPS